MKIHRNISEIDKKQWQQLIDNSPVASFFQTPECYELYASLSFLKPFVFAVSENEKLVGLVCGYLIADGGKIKQHFSRRAIIQGGFLLCENISENALQSLLKTCINELNDKAIYIETRNCSDFSKFRLGFEKSGFCYQSHFDIHLLINAETMQKISDSKLRQIKTAQKTGVQYTETEDIEDIKAFYCILEKLYRKKIKLPLFSIEFFIELSKLPQGKILVIKHNNTVIGGIVCVLLSKKILYEWFVCGDENAEKQLYPSVMATYAGIDYAQKNGFAMFDFMGAGKPKKDYGVRDFKAKFGGELVELGRFLYVCNPFLYRIGKFYIEKLKLL